MGKRRHATYILGPSIQLMTLQPLVHLFDEHEDATARTGTLVPRCFLIMHSKIHAPCGQNLLACTPSWVRLQGAPGSPSTLIYIYIGAPFATNHTVSSSAARRCEHCRTPRRMVPSRGLTHAASPSTTRPEGTSSQAYATLARLIVESSFHERWGEPWGDWSREVTPAFLLVEYQS